MSPSKIEWTTETWNPTTGCDQVSPGCDHCYALSLSARLKAMGQAKSRPTGGPRPPGPASACRSTPTCSSNHGAGTPPVTCSSTA